MEEYIRCNVEKVHVNLNRVTEDAYFELKELIEDY